MKKHAITIFFILILFSYIGWNLMINDELLLSMGSSLFTFIGGCTSAYWLYQAYRHTRGESSKHFWLLLHFGIVCILISSIIWFLSQLITRSSVYPEQAYAFWIMSYLFFLVALIYKIKIIKIPTDNNPYMFNLIISMLSALAISVYFLINPIISLSNSLIVNSVTIAYQLIDLSIFFAMINLYYLSKYSVKRKLLRLVLVGFFLQVLADSIFAHQTILGTYQTGGFIDVIWLLSLLLIGYSGYYSLRTPLQQQDEILEEEVKDTFLPYISVLILLVFVMYSYKWEFNALSIGFTIIFLMIIARLHFIFKKNQRLINEYRFLAFHDPLTGLNNRSSFKNDLNSLLKIFDGNQDRSISLMLVDLDGFKNINDSLGHYIGDLLLKETAVRLQKCIGNTNMVYRLGGDEFIIILPHTTKEEATFIAKGILNDFSTSFLIQEHELNITPSIGITLYPQNGENGETLFKEADVALYQVKENGRNNFYFYNSVLNDRNIRKLKIETEIKKAIEKNQLEIFYQPKFDLKTKTIVGMEALLRWRHPELGNISPFEFIPIAEETGCIDYIGEWVLEHACRQNKTWQDQGYPPLCVSVNASVRQFQNGDFVEMVNRILVESKLKPQYLEIEITESIMQNIIESKRVLNGLRALGVKASLDDFGTGYSSLHVLKDLPIDTIKIDKSFIDDVTDYRHQSVVKSIIDIGMNLNLNVVAEGIERKEQVEMLLEYECTIGQGYFFSKPVPVKSFEDLLKNELHRTYT